MDDYCFRPGVSRRLPWPNPVCYTCDPEIGLFGPQLHSLRSKVVYSYLCGISTMAELNSSKRDHRDWKLRRRFTLALSRKSLLILVGSSLLKTRNSSLSLLLFWPALQFSCSLQVCELSSVSRQQPGGTECVGISTPSPSRGTCLGPASLPVRYLGHWCCPSPLIQAPSACHRVFEDLI